VIEVKDGTTSAISVVSDYAVEHRIDHDLICPCLVEDYKRKLPEDCTSQLSIDDRRSAGIVSNPL